MNFPVIQAAGYVLVNTPDMVFNAGSTFTTEKKLNPASDLLTEGRKHIRSFEEFRNYLPNQIYIGNERYEALEGKKTPFTELDYKNDATEGKFGSLVKEEEFIATLKYADEFDLVILSEEYVIQYKDAVEKRFPEFSHLFSKLVPGDMSKADELIEQGHAIELCVDGKRVGYVRGAHDTDANLNAENMLENLVVKASGAISAVETLKHGNIKKEEIEYVVECSEEAAGDINQRGGGNIAKSIAEMVGMPHATGSDVRGFCAAPVHAITHAAALVQAGIVKKVMVVAGGCTAKLGMNARDHIKKGLPILEDAVAGFGMIIAENDGKNPVIRTDIVGRHTVETGASPQAVITSLVLNPLEQHGLKITDVDKYAPEMQNPDITKPAGAGNVPEANYKMIAALAVTKKQLDRKELKNFVAEKGMVGWAPTQGHIPSAVPYVGHMIDDLTTGDLNRAMLIGKGSLFLGRLTNLFDGLSIVVERNSGELESEAETAGKSDEGVKKVIVEALRKVATELAEEE